MEAENYMDNFEVLKQGCTWVVCEQFEGQSNALFGGQVLKHTKPSHAVRLDEEVVGFSIQEKCTPSCRCRFESPPRESPVPVSPRLSPKPLQGCTNNYTNSNPHVSIWTWKKLARKPGNPTSNYTPMVVDKRPSIEIINVREGKKLCLTNCSSSDKETLKVVASSQH